MLSGFSGNCRVHRADLSKRRHAKVGALMGVSVDARAAVESSKTLTSVPLDLPMIDS